MRGIANLDIFLKGVVLGDTVEGPDKGLGDLARGVVEMAVRERREVEVEEEAM